MPAALNEFRTKLVNNILVAASQQQVDNIIDAAMKQLEIKKVNKNNKVLFVDHIIEQLHLFSAMKKDAQQWSNISMAKILFNRIKNELAIPLD